MNTIFLIPIPRFLLKTIQRLIQFSYQTWIFRGDEARGLLHINFFMKITIWEITLDIHLVNSHWKDARRNDGSDGVHFSKGKNGFSVIHTFFMKKSFGD